MTITTYAELQDEIAAWLDKTDLTARIKAFIGLAEANLRRDLRVADAETSASLTINSRYVDLPSDWLETIRIDCNGNSLRPSSRHDMARMRYEGSASGEPRYWSPAGDKIEFFPTPDSSYTGTLWYFQAMTPLSDANTSNYILATYPDLYLYGSLIHAAPFLVEDERLNVWASLYSAAIKNANTSSNIGQWGKALSVPVSRSFM